MKICLATWAPFVAGAEVAVERLALGLIGDGHDVFIVVGTEGAALKRFQSAGIRCEFIPQRFTDKLKWLTYRRSRNTLVRLLRNERPDIVHSNDLPTHQMVGDAARRASIPRICHHRWIFERTAIDWLNKYQAEQHLFVSNALMNTLCSHSERLAASQCAVVYDGLEIPNLPSEQERRAAKLELSIPKNKITVLYAGQVIQRKGISDLIVAWSKLNQKDKEAAEFIIVGDDLEGEGAYRREIERISSELKVDARFTGFRNDVPRWLVAADIVLVPSHTEPLGNAVLEAMAHGRPVIGTNVGGIPEMLDNDQTGLLVPPHTPIALTKALERLTHDSALRSRLGKAARQTCEARFGISTHVENILAHYTRLIEHPMLPTRA